MAAAFACFFSLGFSSQYHHYDCILFTFLIYSLLLSFIDIYDRTIHDNIISKRVYNICRSPSDAMRCHHHHQGWAGSKVEAKKGGSGGTEQIQSTTGPTVKTQERSPHRTRPALTVIFQKTFCFRHKPACQDTVDDRVMESLSDA